MFRNVLTLLGSLVLLSACSCPHHYLANDDPPSLPAIQVPHRVKVALVLGSGGVRGMAHVGVLEELEKAGIHFDLIVGCSAGSFVGALYADCPNAAQIKHAVGNLRKSTLLDFNFWEARFGLSQGTALKRTLSCHLEARTFDELKIPLVVVATDLNSGELVPLASGDLIKSVKASCAIPLIFVPVEIDGRTFVDGGCINPVPICVARDLGAEIVIAVDLRELLPPTFPTNLIGVAKRSTEIAFLWQNETCCRNVDVLIRPKLCDVGTFDDSQLSQLYEAGRVAALEAIPKIKELLDAQAAIENITPMPDRLVTLEPYSAE